MSKSICKFDGTMQANQIPGQNDLRDIFRQLVEDQRLPHAILIQEGRGGVGLALALLLARMLLCENRQGGDPCDECPNCVKTLTNAHPDLHYIFPNNTNARVKKTALRFSDTFYPEWREAIEENPFMDIQAWYKKIDIEKKQGFIGEEDVKSLREKLALRAHGGGYRVFIVWHADKMNHFFANKVLKNLEEPAEKTVFILVSQHPSALLPTIASRVQIFREELISDQELAKFLQSKLGQNDQESLTAALRAEGNVNAAIKLANHDDEPWLEEFKTWMRLAYARDLAGLLKWTDTMSRKGRDEQQLFCKEALRIIDRCYRMGWMEVHIPMEGAEAKFFNDFSPFINTANAANFLELLEAAAKDIQNNLNQRIIWFDTSIKAIRFVHHGKSLVATSARG